MGKRIILLKEFAEFITGEQEIELCHDIDGKSFELLGRYSSDGPYDRRSTFRNETMIKKYGDRSIELIESGYEDTMVIYIE